MKNFENWLLFVSFCPTSGTSSEIYNLFLPSLKDASEKKNSKEWEEQLLRS
jgi:hypothetical protein